MEIRKLPNGEIIDALHLDEVPDMQQSFNDEVRGIIEKRFHREVAEFQCELDDERKHNRNAIEENVNKHMGHLPTDAIAKELNKRLRDYKTKMRNVRNQEITRLRLEMEHRLKVFHRSPQYERA